MTLEQGNHKMSELVKCPECDGEGDIIYEVPRPHNVNRDVGVIDIEMEICKRCNGDGMVEDDDDDD